MQKKNEAWEEHAKSNFTTFLCFPCFLKEKKTINWWFPNFISQASKLHVHSILNFSILLLPY